MSNWNPEAGISPLYLLNGLMGATAMFLNAGFASADAGPTVRITQPPEIAEASRFQTISITNIGGPYGPAVGQVLENILINARSQDRPVFRAVTRGTASKSDGILTAEVLTATVKDEPYSKTDTVCDRYKELPKDASVFRQLFGKECLSNRKVEIACLRRHAEFSIAVRLADTTNSHIVYSEMIHRTAKDEACRDDSRPLMEENQLLSNASAGALLRIKEAITPTEIEIPLVLMAADAPIERDTDKTRIDSALRFAREKRLDRACEMFNELADAYRTSSVALNFNLGFCEEVNGNAWGANEYYKRADRLTTEPDRRLTEALARSQTAVKRLDAIGKGRPEQVAKIRQPNEKASPQPLLAFAPTASGPIPPELLIEDKRVALVIGNSKYPTMPLTNPANDAADIAARLRKLKFDVVYAENAKLREMDRAFDEYARRLKRGGVALVFYAGHGIQVNGENWLIPVDAALQNEREVSRQAFALNQIMERLELAGTAVNIVILDACRNDPFTRSWKRTINGGGLATVQAPSGTLIAYSTAPGKTAEDGEGRNSPYTKALVSALSVPNLKLEDAFKQAGRNVMQATQNRQVPWNNSSVTGDFYFSTSPIATSVAHQATAPTGKQTAATASRSSPPVATSLAQAGTAPVIAEPAVTTLVQAPIAPQAPADKGPKDFCADRPNFISRQICESRKCKEPQYATDPYCDTYNRKSESPLGL